MQYEPKNNCVNIYITRADYWDKTVEEEERFVGTRTI